MAAMTAAFRSNVIKQLMGAGYSQEEATMIVDRRAMGGADRVHGETLVPDASGTGVRPSGPTGTLYAAVEASPVTQYDQGAIAAMWTGLIDAWRTGGAVDVEALFPDPCAIGLPPPRRYAQERKMGQEMAKLTGLALKALGVTTEEWAAAYAKSATVKIRHADDCGCGCRARPGMGSSAPQLPAAGAAVGNWGSPFGPPTFGGG